MGGGGGGVAAEADDEQGDDIDSGRSEPEESIPASQNRTPRIGVSAPGTTVSRSCLTG